MTLSYPSHTPSTRFPTGTVLALLAAFGFEDYHPYLSQYFSSCGSHYPETPRTFFYKYSMDVRDCIDIVEKLLRQNNRKHKDSHAQMIYERGYLTGMLARMMLESSIVRNEIIDRAKKNSGG